MTSLRLTATILLAGLLGACQFPQPMPGGPSMPMPSGGSSGSAGQSSPSGSQPPASPSGSSGGSTGQSGTSSPSGSSGSSGSSGPPGSEGSASPGGDSGGAPPVGGGEALPWPGPEGGGMEGGDVGDLDAKLDESLGDFDETVMGDGAGAGSEEEIDILNPMGGGSSSQQGDTPVFEEGDLGGEDGGLYEDEGIAQRAAEGGADGSSGGESGGESGGDSGGQQASGGNSGGGASAPQGDANRTASGGGGEAGEDIIPIPDDVGDGRNDDIVLRQIREAAMQEKDPVLREKLWDEYRRIRASR